MKCTRHGLAPILVFVVLSTAGCWFGTGSTSDVRYEFTRQTGVVLEPEFGVKLGRVSTAFGKLFAGRGPDVPRLAGVSKVEVGVYAVADGFGDVSASLTSLDFPGWVRLARVRDGGEEVLVMARPELDGTIPSMLVLVNEGDELVVVRLRGKLHKFMHANLGEILEVVADVDEAMDDLGEAVAELG
ncbi:MAG: DUF4252 domain-containing protein [Acidobacteriota bacterium]|nr:DUF4252 domain-containing protein [Acidobacteriota bacterium]